MLGQACPWLRKQTLELVTAESFTLLLSSQGQAHIEGQRDVFCVQFSTGSINPYKPGESSPVVVQFSGQQDMVAVRVVRAARVATFLLLPVLSPGLPGLARSGGRISSGGSCDNLGYRCGQSAEKFFHRIPKVRGGICTENGAQPWTVEIQVREEGGRYVHRCGGSLISDKFVITATHCFG